MIPRIECWCGFRSIVLEIALEKEHIEAAKRIAAIRGSTAPEEIAHSITLGIFDHMKNNLEIMEKSARVAREHTMRQEVSTDDCVREEDPERDCAHS